MFVKIHDCCIINTDHVVWIDVSDNKMTVKLTDGSEHAVQTDKLDSAMSIINLAANSAAYTK